MRSYYSFEFSKSIEQLLVQLSLPLLLTIVLTKKKSRATKIVVLHEPNGCIKKKTVATLNIVLLLLLSLLSLLPAPADYSKLV